MRVRCRGVWGKGVERKELWGGRAGGGIVSLLRALSPFLTPLIKPAAPAAHALGVYTHTHTADVSIHSRSLCFPSTRINPQASLPVRARALLPFPPPSTSPCLPKTCFVQVRAGPQRAGSVCPHPPACRGDLGGRRRRGGPSKRHPTPPHNTHAVRLPSPPPSSSRLSLPLSPLHSLGRRPGGARRRQAERPPVRAPPDREADPGEGWVEGQGGVGEKRERKKRRRSRSLCLSHRPHRPPLSLSLSFPR